MNHQRRVWTLFGVLLFSGGCERNKASLPPPPDTAERLSTSPTVAYALSPAPQRFISEHHDLEIITPESNLQKAWESAIADCNALHCEVLSSKLTTRAGDATPYGSASFRIIPQELRQFLTEAQNLGTVAQHTTARDDKTTDVVDTEAKIKNLTDFRDNLRAMLTRPTATVRDLIEIQQQLVDTQSDLDSTTAQRKILANETEEVAVDISFQVEESRRNGGAFATIRTALRESGAVLAESTASLITMVVAIVPWLMVLAFVVWILVKVWRQVRRHRKAVAPPPAP
jgi:hypothetical protein